MAAASVARAERAAGLRHTLEGADQAVPGAGRQVAVLALAHGRMALCRAGTELRLPTDDGGGEDACRRALRRAFGHAEAEVRLLGVVPATEARPAIEVWLARRLRRDLSAAPPGGIQWFPPAEIVARVGSPVLREPVTLAALAVAARSELVPEWSAAPLEPPQPAQVPSDDGSRLTLSELRVPQLPARALEAAAPAPEQFINAHLSSLEFIARVLALAEDPGTPLDARLRFLAIVGSNLDHFFMVEVGALKHEVAVGIVDRSPDGLTPAEELDAIAVRLHPLVARQYRAFRDLAQGDACRVTRAGDSQLDELGTASFLQAVAEEVRRRPWGPVVRLEVERTMPPALRELLQRELRFEESSLQSALGPSDVYEAPGPLDLGALGELAAWPGHSGSNYADIIPRDPFAGEPSVFDAIDRGDVLVHHPYDSFAASFERFIAEAADDPAVAAIKLTLYRPGGPSAIGEALRRAAGAGKDLSAFAEMAGWMHQRRNVGRST